MTDIFSFKLITALFAIIIIAGYWIFNFITFYHLTRFGIGTLPKKCAAIFLLGSVGLFSLCTMLFANIDSDSLSRQFEKLGSGSGMFNVSSPIK
ncbi:MAG TPA: hypothetical protein VK675_04460 [Candidatus Paceibacterota bacterium]|nr:hypothetical protein [Candidatus Paceibacterota bacterium]